MSFKIQTLDVRTAAQVARQVGVSQSWLLRQIHAGIIKPDGRAEMFLSFARQD
jgi:hypothetical protein